MGVRPDDVEIGIGLVGAADLRADSGEARCKTVFVESGVVAPDRRDEFLAAGVVEVIVATGNPAHVGPEARGTGEVQGQMHAQAAGNRDRVDEMPERGLPPQFVIVAFAKPRACAGVGCRWGEGQAGQRRGIEPGGVDDVAGAEFVSVGHAQAQALGLLGLDAVDAAAVGDLPADRFEVGQQRQHQGGDVDDAGAGRQERADAAQVGLESARFGGGEPREVVDAVVVRAPADALQGFQFGVVDRDEQLADPAVRNRARLAVFVEQHAPADAQAGFVGAGLVVEAGVDHARIARARLLPKTIAAFHDQGLAAAQLQRPADRQPDDPGTDHDAVCLVHSRRSFPMGTRCAGSRKINIPPGPTTTCEPSPAGICNAFGHRSLYQSGADYWRGPHPVDHFLNDQSIDTGTAIRPGPKDSSWLPR